MGGATAASASLRFSTIYFNPRSPWGERPSVRLPKGLKHGFQSTLPVGGATTLPPGWFVRHLFQSTLPVGGATFPEDLLCYRENISIHAPRGGSDLLTGQVFRVYKVFQSTLPVGGATGRWRKQSVLQCISIHAPRGGSDAQNKKSVELFNISIHAPRGGSDQKLREKIEKEKNFNPRSPWGERLAWGNSSVVAWGFQSTLPVGGATGDGGAREASESISIHAPRGGSDSNIFRFL